MHRSVGSNFVLYSSPIEGVFSWLYPDIKGFLTTAIGCIANTVALALGMAWRLPNGDLASPQQVTAEWTALNARAYELRNYLASNHVIENATTIRLDDAGVAKIVTSRLLAIEARMRAFFSDWDNFPADAQLALLSLGWALGSDFEPGYPKLTAAANRGDWATCALECQISSTGNPGVIVRNAQNVLLFHNAQSVAQYHLDAETLYWPGRAPDVPPDVEDSAAAARSLAPFPAASLALELGAFAYPVDSDSGQSGRDITDQNEDQS